MDQPAGSATPHPAFLELRDERPRSCCRLFDLGPLRNREFLVGREEHLAALLATRDRWAEGQPCSVARTGPEGSGKTLFFNCFQNELGDRTPVSRVVVAERLRTADDLVTQLALWFELPEACRSLEEAVAQIRALPRRIVLVEGGHQLLLRVIGGRRAAEAFFYLLMATRSHWMGVVSSRRYPWGRGSTSPTGSTPSSAAPTSSGWRSACASRVRATPPCSRPRARRPWRPGSSRTCSS